MAQRYSNRRCADETNLTVSTKKQTLRDRLKDRVSRRGNRQEPPFSRGRRYIGILTLLIAPTDPLPSQTHGEGTEKRGQANEQKQPNAIRPCQRFSCELGYLNFSTSPPRRGG